MTRHKVPLYQIVRRIALLVIVAIGLLAPSLARAQSSGPYVDSCVYNGVDWTNDVEQETCLYGDASELDASADVDSWAYEDSSNWPSGDLYVVGLGAQGQLFDNESNLVADTGMVDNGPYSSMAQSNQQLPDGYAFTSITPQPNIWYTLNGLYSECYDTSDSGSDSCYWWGPLTGLTSQAMVTSSMLQPTLTLSSSAAPSVYQNSVTFTVNLTNEPDEGGVCFYDGSTELGCSLDYGSAYNSATFTTSSLSVGTHSITATWPGDFDTNPATSNTFAQVVNPITYDSGSVSLTVGGTTETASFGQGSTDTTIAQSLAASFSGNSQVSVNAFGNLLTITASQSGSSGDYSFVASDSYNSGIFSSPSFYPSSSSGYLSGGSTGGQSPLYSFSGSYDTNGNVLGYTDSVMGSWNFGYDEVNRLVTATNAALPLPNTLVTPYPSWAQNFCWAYDAVGNRLQQSTSDAAFSWGDASCTFNGTQYQNTLASYNSQNQITSTNAPGFTLQPPGYDNAGNITVDGINHYSYDAEGRLCAVWTPTTGWMTYLYDAAGNRVAKGFSTDGSCNITSNSFQQTAAYIVDGGGQQLTEVDGSNNWKHTNVWANGKQIGTYDSAGLHFYFDDPLGTRRAQVNASGVLEAVYQSLPYGDDLNSAGPAGDPTENHFTGKERDTESGNDYFGARYYASTMGRFLSPDWSAKVAPVPYAKLDNPQTLNLYSYVGNNPLSRFDPDGHWVCGGNSDQCAQIQTRLNLAGEAVKNLGAKSKEGAAIQKVIDLYGPLSTKAGDKGDNGVNVSFGSMKRGEVGTAHLGDDGHTVNIKFDLGQLNTVGNNTPLGGADRFPVGAGVVIHEGTHGIDERRWGHNPFVGPQDDLTEHNAYRNESFVYQGLNTTDYLSGLWRPGITESERDAAIDAAAKGSEGH